MTAANDEKPHIFITPAKDSKTIQNRATKGLHDLLSAISAVLAEITLEHGNDSDS